MFEFANVCDECFCQIMDNLIYFHGLFNIIVLVSNELIECILFCVPLRMFLSYGDVTIGGRGLQLSYGDVTIGGRGLQPSLVADER